MISREANRQRWAACALDNPCVLCQNLSMKCIVSSLVRPGKEANVFKGTRRSKLALLLALWIVPLVGVGWGPVRMLADPIRWTIRELSPLAYGRSLALDAAGRPHVAHGAWHSVIYAYEVAAFVWADEVIASHSSFDVGGAALALDTAGKPQVAYTQWYPSGAQADPPPGTPRGSLLWAEKGSAGWEIAEIQSTEGVRYGLGAVALSIDGTRHIVFTTVDDANTSSVWYGRRVGTEAWALALIAQAGEGTWGAGAADLVLDKQNRPVISYRGHDTLGPFVGVTALDGTWRILLRVDGDQAYRTALEVAPDGTLHLLYAAAVRQELVLVSTLKHFWQESGDWAHEVAREGAFDSDIAVDGTGEPHAVWIEGNADQGYGTLTYARRAGGAWEGEPVSANASGPQLALDGSGGPHVVFDVGAVLRYARRPQEWTTPTVPATGSWLFLPLVWR